MLKIPLQKKICKKRLAMSASVISNFFKVIDLHKKVNFVEDLGLLIIKSHLPI
jgi:hypothetical protein